MILRRVDTVGYVLACIATSNETLKSLPVFVDDGIVGLTIEFPDVDGTLEDRFVARWWGQSYVRTIAMSIGFVVHFQKEPQ